MFRKILIVGLATLGLAACGATTQGAVAGGAMGAAAGAIIGNNTGSGDARTGAIIGGAIGAAGGAYAGCRSEGTCMWDQNNAHQSRLYTDQRTGGQYYLDDRDGCSYWRNGERRGC